MPNILPFLFLLCLQANGIFLSPDTCLLFRFDSVDVCKPWLTPLSGHGMEWTGAAAIRGDQGLQIETTGPREDGYRYQKVRYLPDSWHRLYFRVDSVFPDTNPPEVVLKGGRFQTAFFFECKMEKEAEKNKPASGLRYKLFHYPDKNTLGLQCVWGNNKIEVPIEIGRPYCIESHLTWLGNDSVAVEVWQDGLFINKIKESCFYKPDSFILILSPDSRFLTLRMSVDEAVFGNRRIYPIPGNPTEFKVADSRPLIKIINHPYESLALGEYIRQSVWRFFSFDDSIFPIYTETRDIPADLYCCQPSFPMDTGKFYCVVKYCNNFGNKGYFGKRVNFDITTFSPKRKYIRNVFISKEPNGKPLPELASGRWYYMNVFLKDPLPALRLPWDSLSYLLVELNDTAYLDGNIGNKGGKFLSASNYIINLSLAGNVNTYYEKNVDSSFGSSVVPKGATGLYVDSRKESMIIDSSRQYIGCRFRLLKNADVGLWKLSAVLFYLGRDSTGTEIVDIPSNNFRSNYRVVDEGYGYLGKIVLFCLLLVIVFVFFGLVYRRMKRGLPVSENGPEAIDFQTNGLVLYINSHLAEPMTVDKVKMKLGLNRDQFKQLVKRTGKGSFLELLNSLRMEKAKELLAFPDKSIESICMDVGFSDNGYFAKVFFKHTGVTPKKYQLSVIKDKYQV